MENRDGLAGRDERRLVRRTKRSRRRRFWAGLIGGIIGWGLAGLDGGEAGTVTMPPLDVDFTAAGTYSTSALGTVTFELAGNVRVVRQVIVLPDSEIEMLFDRMAAKVTVIRDSAVDVLPAASGVVRLFEPFAQAQYTADGPLEIVRDGIGSHLGHSCERYRALGHVGGAPLRATTCITSSGIPLFTETVSATHRSRAELTALSFVAPDPRRLAEPTVRLRPDRASAAGVPGGS